MRLRDEGLLRSPLLRGLVLCAAAGLVSGCLGGGSASPGSTGAAPVSANGPQADYPILIGAPYEVNGVRYTPLDTLNYDEVGTSVLDDGAMGVSGAHHTLPVPSYVEVTSLETGRTILVRLERRGPMASNDLVALSPAAFAQLEAEAGVPVRVRRVNPPEEQRAMLRSGNMAPARMDTPMSLVTVLKRKLPEATPAAEVTASDAPAAVQEPEVAVVEADPLALPSQVPAAAPPAPAPTPSAMGDSFFVQAAAFSTQERADRAAKALDAFVLPGEPYFRVRTGPFATREEASASLAKIRAAGYDDARILKGG